MLAEADGGGRAQHGSASENHAAEEARYRIEGGVLMADGAGDAVGVGIEWSCLPERGRLWLGEARMEVDGCGSGQTRAREGRIGR